ncbi:nitroreductase family protein [Amycolatopsis cynarae]|uniref:Nitroreductase family protein n=1 Tax=Amycolatopsis cynarae TaxID=2995223 RepID=A0ABY7B1S9_9PSEU|nr:nitroreductase family protein [Amycolatopsis sp. HUAS 11-8]WAL66244.1 nitroreductase family protein [Amycolatopsis sp. HUAS 11-8]
MDADTLLTTTRAVRRKLDLDRPVAPEVITDCLRIAMQAPIAGNMLTGIRWLVVRDDALKAKIADAVREVGRAAQEQYGHLVAPRALASASHLLDIIDRVPVLVLACLEGRPEGGNGELTGFYGSIYPAIWSFQLALRARGLGSTITGYHLFGHEREVGELLGIPEEFTQIALLPVAYTTQRDFSPAARPPVEEITYFDGWGRTSPLE